MWLKFSGYLRGLIVDAAIFRPRNRECGFVRLPHAQEDVSIIRQPVQLTMIRRARTHTHIRIVDVILTGLQ